MKLNPYPKYKDSGFDWLSNIPKHWKMMTIRALVKVINFRGRPDLPILSVYRDYGVIRKDSRDDNFNRDGEDLSAYKVVKPGFLVLNKMKTWQGSLGISKDEGIVSPAYIVCKFIKYLNKKYVHYLLRSSKYITAYNRISYGVRVNQWDMRFNDFKQLPVFLPPIEEQDKIAFFLDLSLNRISRFIQGKRRLIELLKEQKQAIINQAVTRGLDPNVRFKPSGIDWLGDIPEHWEVRRLKTILKEPLKYGANEPAELNDPNLPRYIRITDITENGELREDTFRSLPINIAKNYLLKEGDLLFARSGATVGKTFCYKINWGNAAFAGYLIKASIDNTKAYIDYISLFTKSKVYWNWISSSFIQSTIQNVSAEKYASLYLALPPLQEQYKILNYVMKYIGNIHSAIARAEREIELIREYRTRLIADVVTGKVDVRHIPVTASPDSMDIEEPKELDPSLETAEAAEPQENPDEND